MSRKLTPWQKIVRASKQGKGLTLTRDEVFELAGLDAIQAIAAADDENAGSPTEGK